MRFSELEHSKTFYPELYNVLRGEDVPKPPFSKATTRNTVCVSKVKRNYIVCEIKFPEMHLAE